MKHCILAKTFTLLCCKMVVLRTLGYILINLLPGRTNYEQLFTLETVIKLPMSAST